MDKTWFEVITDKVVERLHERLSILVDYDADDIDCGDIDEIHHIYEVFHIVKTLQSMK